MAKELLKHKFLLFLSFFFQTLNNIATVSKAYILMLLVDSIMNSQKSEFIKDIQYIILVQLCSMILDFVVLYIQNLFVRENMISLKVSILDIIFTSPYELFHQKETNYYQSFVINDIRIIEDNYYRGILSIFKVFSLLITSLIMVIMINPWFVLGYPIALGVCFLIPLIYQKRLPRFSKRVMEINQKFMKLISEQLNGFGTIKSFQLFNKTKKLRDECIRSQENEKTIFSLNIQYSNAILFALVAAIWVFIYYVGGSSVINNSITVGAFVALLRLVPDILNPCIQLPQYINQLNSCKPTLEKCKEIYSYKSKINNQESKVGLAHDITLNQLTFSYLSSNEPILNNITYTFKKGKKYALVGENGSGKSTLLKLLAGYYNEFTGNIFYDNQNRKDISEVDIYSIVSYMSQDIFLFDESIENNIHLDFDYCQDYYHEVIGKLSIDQLIDQAFHENKNIDSLSGGEKQRISIARSLMKNSHIILADEPTSALDQLAIKNFDDLIGSLENKLIVVVTHDLNERLKNYDEILVFQNGSLIEHGSYDELVNNQDYFYHVLLGCN